jgi:hypothetical protein
LVPLNKMLHPKCLLPCQLDSHRLLSFYHSNLILRCTIVSFAPLLCTFHSFDYVIV